VELNLQRAEQEKQTKDSQIRTLTDELTRQEETMARVNRDKKNLEELLKKTQEDLAGEEDKCNNLTKTKQKLEQTLDEVSYSSPVSSHSNRGSLQIAFITFRVSRRPREMYCGHSSVCLSVCVSVGGCMPTPLHGPGCNLGVW